MTNKICLMQCMMVMCVCGAVGTWTIGFEMSNVHCSSSVDGLWKAHFTINHTSRNDKYIHSNSTWIHSYSTWISRIYDNYYPFLFFSSELSVESEWIGESKNHIRKEFVVGHKILRSYVMQLWCVYIIVYPWFYVHRYDFYDVYSINLIVRSLSDCHCALSSSL